MSNEVNEGQNTLFFRLFFAGRRVSPSFIVETVEVCVKCVLGVCVCVCV